MEKFGIDWKFRDRYKGAQNQRDREIVLAKGSR